MQTYVGINATRQEHGLPALRTIAWILVAMVTARSCAMSFNRWADAELDAANPRTATRAI